MRREQSGVCREDGNRLKGGQRDPYWLHLVRDSQTLSHGQVQLRLKEAEELIRILTAIIKTSQKLRNQKLNIQHSSLSIAKVAHE